MPSTIAQNYGIESMSLNRQFNCAVLALLVSCTSWLLAAPVHAKSENADIATVLKNSGQFQYLYDSLKHSGHLEELLHAKGPFTLFAAQDKTFDKLGLSTWVGLWSDQRRLKQIISYGIVKGRFDARNLPANKELLTLEGHSLRVEQRDNKLFVGNARIRKDIKCSNGVIHIVDRLLAPPAATAGIESVQ